jgi:RNA ligase (TIGR02306 family)
MSSLIVEVCKIDRIEKHPNADKLSIVGVKGWSCIVGLDQYNVGQLVIYCPPDCIIPQNLIEKYNLEYLKKNGRTGTIKLRGYISQGLILDLPDGNWHEGDDISSFLGITKWEPPQASYQNMGVKKTSRKRINPAFDKYTEIENIKHYPDVLKEGDLICITEKIHGANSRYGVLPIAIQDNAPLIEKFLFWIKKNILKQKYEFVYGSHQVQITAHSNRKSFYGGDVWGEMIDKYNLDKLIPENTIIYAELYGAGIQDLTYGLGGYGTRDIAVFDIKQNGEYLDWEKVVELCNKIGLRHVPQLYIGPYYNGVVEKYTDGNSILYGGHIREGCVTKSLYEESDIQIGRKILKSISGDYLLRKNGTEYT